MAPPVCPRSPWHGRAVLLATLLAVVLLAAHPELRLFVPVVEALGLDVFLGLIGAQVWAWIHPALGVLHRHGVEPLGRRVFAAGIWWLGMMGPFVGAWFAARWRRGPAN
jgi:hypothetical protein